MSERQRNQRLAVAIAEDGRPIYVIAAASRINGSMFGGILSGRVIPSAAARARIASALARSEHELFEPIEVTA